MRPSRAFVLVALGLGCCAPAGARAAGEITIEKATVPWSELERLLRKEGGAPPPRKETPGAPLAYGISQASVEGTVGDGHAELEVDAEVQVLAEHWVVVPLLPAGLAVSSGQVTPPDRRRGLLVRDGRGVALAAEGPGRFVVRLSAAGDLERARGAERLALPLSGVAGGKARLVVRGTDRITGATAWRVRPGGAGTLVAEAALGSAGVELVLPAGARPDPDAGLEDLEATTVLGLDGTGVTDVVFHATPVEGAPLVIELPEGAQPWKVFVGGRSLSPRSVAQGRRLQIPVARASRVEVAYTFSGTPLGIRGRYRVELPAFTLPLRGARWQVWLPEGLTYGGTQASLPAGGACTDPPPEARARLKPQGGCRAYARPVLDPGRAYVEGTYAQAL